jgi:predicted RNase H-like nuclease (RuvC/YqgF family)
MMGCGLTSPPPSLTTTTIEPVSDTVVIISPSPLLDNIESTLEMADEVMSKREKEQNLLNKKIYNLVSTISQEEELIVELQRKLAVKDSIIKNKNIQLEATLEKLESTQYQVENTEEIIQRYILSYNVLLEENSILQSELDETYSQVEYLDSLIFTNKKLTKVYESN